MEFPDDINNYETGSIDSPKKSRIVNITLNIFRKLLIGIWLNWKGR